MSSSTLGRNTSTSGRQRSRIAGQSAPPARGVGVGQAEVEGDDGYPRLRPLQEALQLRAAVRVEARHEGRVAEVHDLDPVERLVREVLRAEGVVAAGRVDKGPVGALHLHHDGVARRGLRADGEVAAELAQERADDAAEGVVADHPDEPHRQAKGVERPPHVAHRAARAQGGGTRLDEPPRRQLRHPREGGDDVQAQVPGDEDGGHRPVIPKPCRPCVRSPGRR